MLSAELVEQSVYELGAWNSRSLKQSTGAFLSQDWLILSRNFSGPELYVMLFLCCLWVHHEDFWILCWALSPQVLGALTLIRTAAHMDMGRKPLSLHHFPLLKWLWLWAELGSHMPGNGVLAWNLQGISEQNSLSSGHKPSDHQDSCEDKTEEWRTL